MVLKVYRANNTAIPAVKSVTYKTAVNADVDLRPGCVSSAYITVEVFGAQSTAPAVGEALKCYRLDTGGTETLLGIFYAEPAVSSKKTYTVVAYDAIHKLDVDYSTRLADIQSDFPMTLADLVDDVCGVAGITCDTTGLPLGSTNINAFYADGLTCRDMLSYAAELTGQYVVANTSGAAVFTWYSTLSGYRINPTNGTDSGTTLIAYKQDGLEYAKYSITPPPCVAVKPSGVEGAAYIYPTNVSSVYATDDGYGNITLYNLTAVDDGSANITLSGDITATDDGNANVDITASGGGSTDNALIISGNILLTDASDATFLAVAEQIYNQMQLLPTYRPARAELFPLETPFLVGEVVSVKDAQNVSFTMPIMSLTISNAAMVAEATGNERRVERNSVDKDLANLAATVVQIDKLKVGWAEIDEAIINTVETNEIKSSDYVPANDGIFAESGMAIDFSDKEIKAVDFAVDSDGKLYTSAADIAGVEFNTLRFYANLIWNVSSTSGGYSWYGTIPYRNLVEITVNGLTSATISVKFDYYNGSTLVSTYSSIAWPVSPFRIPLYKGEADGVKIGIKLPLGETATIYTRNVSSERPQMTVPSGAAVTFNSEPSFNAGAIVDGVTLDSTTLLTAKRFSVASNDSTTVSLDNSTRGVIVMSGIGTGGRGLYFWSCSSTGAVVVTDGIAGSALTLTSSTNSITVASTSANIAYGVVINF